MKVKTKNLSIETEILGKEEEFLLIAIEPCKKYEKVNQKITDEIDEYKYTISIVLHFKAKKEIP